MKKSTIDKVKVVLITLTTITGIILFEVFISRIPYIDMDAERQKMREYYGTDMITETMMVEYWEKFPLEESSDK